MIALSAFRTKAAVAGIAALCLVLAACGSKAKPSTSTPPATTGGGSTTSAATGSLDACMILDTGGIDDHSFNQTSYQGMTAANAANSNIKISYVPSNTQNDYTPNLNAEVAKNCQAIVAVGGLMSTAVAAAAKAHPTFHFAEVDAPSAASNMYGMQFNTAQGAFLGGYLAAGMTKTDTVATYGGLNIPPVTIYMDGFWEGVQYYNTQNGTHVKVLGWDEANQKAGTFAQSFTDQNKGEQITQAFVAQGADIVFPVAGGTGLGSGAAAQSSGGKLKVIWVDTDGCVSAAQYCGVFLASVTKNLAGAVTTYLEAAATGTFPTVPYIGTLANNGTGLTLGSQLSSSIPATLQAKLATVKAAIIAGTIKITSPSQPS